MKEKDFLNMNLQFFAEDITPDNTEGTEPKGQETEVKTEETKEQEPKATDEKKYSDADLDAILDKKFAKWKSKAEKEIDEAKKLAEMNAQQKAEYERDQLQTKLEELTNKNTLNEMGKTARSILKESGVTVSDDIIATLITTDATQTKANVDNFAAAFKEAVENEVKNKLKSTTPKTGTPGKAMTKDEIMAISDGDTRRQAIQDNLTLFE